MSSRLTTIEPSPASSPVRTGLIRRWVHKLASLGETPHRTSLAFALGVFLSFSPFLGFQILMGMTLAFALGLSRAAVLIGLCVNLPWIMVPWYAATTAVGAAALGAPLTADFSTRLTGLFENPVYRSAFWGQASEVLSPLFWSFALGSFTGATLLSVAAYFVMARVLVASSGRISASV